MGTTYYIGRDLARHLEPYPPLNHRNGKDVSVGDFRWRKVSENLAGGKKNYVNSMGDQRDYWGFKNYLADKNFDFTSDKSDLTDIARKITYDSFKNWYATWNSSNDDITTIVCNLHLKNSPPKISPPKNSPPKYTYRLGDSDK